MRLACPNCGTRYRLDRDLVPDTGRTATCSRCGHAWKATPDQLEPEPAPEPEGPSALEDIQADMGAPDAEPEPEPEPEPAPPEEEEAPAGADQSQDDIDALFGGGGDQDDMEGEAAEGTPDWGEAPQDDSGLEMSGEPDDESRLDDAFGEVHTEVPEYSEDMAPRHGPDVTEDPEPIPEMFASPPPDYEEGGGGGVKKALKWTAILLVLAVIAGAASAWWMRAAIVTRFPEAEQYYAMVGIDVDTLGLGLEFSNVTPERTAEGGQEVLILRGIVENVTDRERPLPGIELGLYDQGGSQVQSKTALPPVNRLDPGATVGFRIRLPSVSPRAHRFEVFFTPRETVETQNGE